MIHDEHEEHDGKGRRAGEPSPLEGEGARDAGGAGAARAASPTE